MNSKERPIIFSSEMVRALLDGRKTQTRRLIKGRDVDLIGSFPVLDENSVDLCRFGKVGDKLWVREKIYCFDGNTLPKSKGEHFDTPWHFGCDYAADTCHDTDPTKTISPIYMPRWCCRLELVLTEVCIERLNDISWSDAIAEGVEKTHLDHGCQCYKNYKYHAGGKLNPLESYMSLWNSIAKYGHRWADNPWVWLLKFDCLIKCN